MKAVSEEENLNWELPWVKVYQRCVSRKSGREERILVDGETEEW